MNQDEIRTLAVMQAVQLISVTLLSHIITNISPVTHEQIATAFEQESERVPGEDAHARLARAALTQIAGSIRNSQDGGAGWEALLDRLRR